MGLIHFPVNGNGQPWKGAIHAPSEKVLNDTSSPQSHLQLEWIHGYRVGVDEAFNNVRYIPGKRRRITYNAAAVGVVLDLEAEVRTWRRTTGIGGT